MAASYPAVVLQQVFEMLRRTGGCGIQPVESRDGEQVQIYQSPTIVQFYIGGCGLPGPGDEDGSAANGSGPRGGYVRDGRVEVPVGHGQSHREAFEGRKDSVGAGDVPSLTGAGTSSQAQQDLGAVTMDAGRERTPTAPDTASMKRDADALIAAMMRGKKLTPRHRRLLVLALQDHPPQAYEEHRRPSSAAQLHQEDDEEDSDDDDDETFAGIRSADLSPQSRERYDRQRYLNQTYGLAEPTLTSPKSIGPARDERVQTPGNEEVAEGDPSSRAAGAEANFVSAPLHRRASTVTRSDQDVLHASSKQPEDSSEGYERMETPLGKYTRLDGRPRAERLRSRESSGRPQSVHEPRMMPTGYRLRPRSSFREFHLKDLARKRHASDAVAAGDEDVQTAEPDESGLNTQATGDEHRGSVEAGETDWDVEDGEEIRVQASASKRRKILSESSDEETNDDGEGDI